MSTLPSAKHKIAFIIDFVLYIIIPPLSRNKKESHLQYELKATDARLRRHKLH
jgi:hypothetical protein